MTSTHNCFDMTVHLFDISVTMLNRKHDDVFLFLRESRRARESVHNRSARESVRNRSARESVRNRSARDRGGGFTLS